MNRTAKTDAMTVLPFYSQFIYENTSDFFFLWTHLPMGFSQISFLSNGILGNKYDLSLSWSSVFHFFKESPIFRINSFPFSFGHFSCLILFSW